MRDVVVVVVVVFSQLEYVLLCASAGLSNCVDKCSRHSCSPTTKDNFTCVQAPRSIADCSDLLNNGTCLHLKVDFTGNGFVR